MPLGASGQCEGKWTCFGAEMPDAEDVLLGELGALSVRKWKGRWRTTALSRCGGGKTNGLILRQVGIYLWHDVFKQRAVW